MALDLPRPTVPNLDQFGVLDIEALNQQGLITTCKATTAARGKWLHPQWKGTTSAGKALDIHPPPQLLVTGNEEMTVVIPYNTLELLDQGHAVFSYTVQPDQSFEYGHDESDRVNILVGTRQFPGAGLNVASIREANRLQFDHEDIPSNGAMAAVPPWQAMHPGDTVTVLWQGYASDGSAIMPEIELTHDVVEAEIGLPLAFYIPRTSIVRARGGRGVLSYAIEYVGGGQTVAPAQTFTISPASTDRPPALRILEHSGGTIDPGVVSDGLTFSIGAYPELQEGDSLIISAEDPASRISELVVGLRLDRSSVDSGLLNVSVQGDWLDDYLDRDIALRYQVARPGMGLGGEPLTLAVRATMVLPMPVVDGASGAGEAEGEYKAWDAVEGIVVRVPSKAVYPAGAVVQMHWEGFPGVGSEVVTLSSGGTPPTFRVSASVVMANIGRVVNVFYRVAASGEAPRDSEVFKLKVLPIAASGYPTLQCPDATNGELSISGLQGRDARLTLAPWALIAIGQNISIAAIGTLRNGVTTTEELYSRPVTSATAPVATYVGGQWFSTLAINSKIEFTVTVIAGETEIVFPRMYLKMLA